MICSERTRPSISGWKGARFSSGVAIGAATDTSCWTYRPCIRGWKRLLAAIGLGSKSEIDSREVPDDRNVLHFDEETRQEMQRRSLRTEARALLERAVARIEAYPETYPEYDPKKNILKRCSLDGKLVQIH